MEKVRTTAHRSRKGTNGKTISPKHNDRDFDTGKAEHINEADKDKNIYWKFDENVDGKVIDEATRKPRDITLDEYEKAYYEKYFSEQLSVRNQKQIAAKHKSRVQDIDQFRKTRNYCPEEVILNIGNVKNRKEVTPEIMKECYEEFVKWHNQNYPNCPIIDGALHADEPNASIHIHSRQIWFTEAKSDDGNLYREIGQQNALDAMGIQPSGDKEKGERYYNSKITYTAEIRNKWAEIAEAHGFEIDRTPQPESKKGRSLAKLKADTLKEETEELERRKEESIKEVADLDKQVADLTEQTEQKQKEVAELTEKADTLQSDVDKLSIEYAQKTEAMQTVNAIQIPPRPELPQPPILPSKPVYEGVDTDKLGTWTFENVKLPQWEKKCEKIKAQHEKDLQTAQQAQSEWDSIYKPVEAIKQASAEVAEREKAVTKQAAKNREDAKNLLKQKAEINREVAKEMLRHQTDSPFLQLLEKQNQEYSYNHPTQTQETHEKIQTPTAEKVKTPLVKDRPTSDSAAFKQRFAALNAPKPTPTVQPPTVPRTTAPRTHTHTHDKGEYER